AASGAYASSRWLCERLHLRCALDIRICRLLSIPPSTASEAHTMPRVPSSKVSRAEPQFSTSTQPVPTQWRGSASKPGRRVRSPTSAITALGRIGRPQRRSPSWRFKCSIAPIGCTARRNSAPPPVVFHSLEYGECEPLWHSPPRISRIAPPEAAASRLALAIDGAYTHFAAYISRTPCR